MTLRNTLFVDTENCNTIVVGLYVLSQKGGANNRVKIPIEIGHLEIVFDSPRHFLHTAIGTGSPRYLPRVSGSKNRQQRGYPSSNSHPIRWGGVYSAYQSNLEFFFLYFVLSIDKLVNIS